MHIFIKQRRRRPFGTIGVVHTDLHGNVVNRDNKEFTKLTVDLNDNIDVKKQSPYETIPMVPVVGLV